MFDASRHGPACSQGSGGFQADMRRIGEVELPEPQLTYSEFECLHVVVTTPKRLEPTSSLPVVVWVHGGGFSIGSNAWPQYNLTRLVEQSLNEKRPVIGVSINYRLGMFGFLASAVHSLWGNYGLKDLVCGFEWIKRHIEGFGGDPLAVTAVGESAGSICLSTLLTHKHPLFTRCVLMSGDITLRRPRTMDWHESMFQQTIDNLHIADTENDNIMLRLNALSAGQIVQLLPLTDHWSPCLDGQFLNDSGTAELGIKSTWCRHILMGDMGDDGTILRSRFLDCPNAIDKTLQACKKVLTITEIDTIWRAYALDDASKQDTGLLGLASELRFHLPVLNTRTQLTAGGDTQVSTYHIHQANPFPGDNRGLASHELDVMYMLHNFDHILSAADVDFGNRVSGLLLKFTNEQDVGMFRPTTTLAMGPDCRIQRLNLEQYDTVYRNGRGRMLLGFGAKKCLLLGEMLQGVPFSDL